MLGIYSFGNRAAHDSIDELITRAGLLGLDMQLTMTELTTTTGLTDISALDIHSLGDGFAVRNLRSAHRRLDFVFSEQAVYDDLQVQLAHAGDDCLACLFIRVGFKRRVFLREFHQGNAHLIAASLGFGLNGNPDNRVREDHGFEDDGVFLVTERIARTHVF